MRSKIFGIIISILVLSPTAVFGQHKLNKGEEAPFSGYLITSQERDHILAKAIELDGCKKEVSLLEKINERLTWQNQISMQIEERYDHLIDAQRKELKYLYKQAEPLFVWGPSISVVVDPLDYSEVSVGVGVSITLNVNRLRRR